jgi:hypothetical protein
MPANGGSHVRAAQQLVYAVGLDAVATETEKILLRTLVMLGADAHAHCCGCNDRTRKRSRGQTE